MKKPETAEESTQIPDWLKLLLNQASELEVLSPGGDLSRVVVLCHKIPWTVLPEQIGEPRNLDGVLDLLVSIFFDDDSNYLYFIGIWNIEKGVDLHSASSTCLPNFKIIASCSEFFQDLATVIDAAKQLRWI